MWSAQTRLVVIRGPAPPTVAAPAERTRCTASPSLCRTPSQAKKSRNEKRYRLGLTGCIGWAGTSCCSCRLLCGANLRKLRRGLTPALLTARGAVTCVVAALGLLIYVYLEHVAARFDRRGCEGCEGCPIGGLEQRWEVGCFSELAARPTLSSSNSTTRTPHLHPLRTPSSPLDPLPASLTNQPTLIRPLRAPLALPALGSQKCSD